MAFTDKVNALLGKAEKDDPLFAYAARCELDGRQDASDQNGRDVRGSK
jgi:hypothetical protein